MCQDQAMASQRGVQGPLGWGIQQRGPPAYWPVSSGAHLLHWQGCCDSSGRRCCRHGMCSCDCRLEGYWRRRGRSRSGGIAVHRLGLGSRRDLCRQGFQCCRCSSSCGRGSRSRCGDRGRGRWYGLYDRGSRGQGGSRDRGCNRQLCCSSGRSSCHSGYRGCDGKCWCCSRGDGPIDSWSGSYRSSSLVCRQLSLELCFCGHAGSSLDSICRRACDCNLRRAGLWSSAPVAPLLWGW